jgi:hypothetical protein
LADKRLSDDVFREMGELREGGKPGVTGNQDAKYLADVFAKHVEASRTDLNRLGAAIGKLDGWAGAQVHDDMKMIAAGKDAWIDGIAPHLDLNRTFPDANSADELRKILGDMYDTIITGVPNKATAKEKGQRVNPANLAKSLGKTRVLHFKDAESAIAYRDAFGYGNSIYGIMAHQRRAASMAAQMDAFGPNPELMFDGLVENQKRILRDSPSSEADRAMRVGRLNGEIEALRAKAKVEGIKADDRKLAERTIFQKEAELKRLSAASVMSDADKVKAINKLNADAGPLRGAFDVMSGAISRPGNVTAAKLGSDIRAVQSMAKLGAAVMTAMPTDIVGAAQASMFRGNGFFNGMVKQVGGMFAGRPKKEQAEISFLFGEGFDGMVGEIISHGLANDGPVGKMSGLTDSFFKWSGLNWWTDVGRSVVGRTVAAEMGMRAETAHADLPANYKHVLGLHGIGEKQWEALRQAQRREVNGSRYITPDAVGSLSDEAVAPLVESRLASAKTPERKAEILNDGRRELQMSLLRFVADETNYAIVETDAASRRIASLGTRPGTFAGEAARFIMQFKGFPIAFSQRILGRALFGGRGATKYERIMNNAPHIGALIGGLTVAGYMAMTMKDAAKGYWPPRDPLDPKVMTAALTQGGALGIYGDFLFGQQNRFGSGALETFSGPFIGTMSDIINVPLKARASLEKGERPHMAGDLLNLALNNTPWVNLSYVRPALDILFVNSLRNWASPGYVNRQQRGRLKDYGQRPLLPSTISEALR